MTKRRTHASSSEPTAAQAPAFKAETEMLTMLREMVHGSRLFAAQGGPLHGALEEGHPDSRALVLVGPNASGKSLAVRLLSSWLNEEKVEPLQVSMRYRTQAGIHRAFMFGPFGDAEDSTGNVSVNAIQGAVRTARGRESAHWLFFDEPDIGLSEGYAWAMGAFLAQAVNEGPGPRTQGVVLVTHSRELVRSFFEHCRDTPHFMDMSPQQLHRDEWLGMPQRQSVADLLSLGETSVMTHRAIEAVLKR